jgi:hypothetical protein
LQREGETPAQKRAATINICSLKKTVVKKKRGRINGTAFLNAGVACLPAYPCYENPGGTAYYPATLFYI